MSDQGRLAGVRIGVLQTRHARELAALIEREGGRPLLAPCLREVRDDGDGEVLARIREVAGRPPDLFVFQTGVGTRALFELAAGAGLNGPLADAARAATVLARGPKPLAALLDLGLRVDLRTAEPHTTGEVRGLLDAVPLSGRRVALQHYGSPNGELVRFLRGHGAEVIELFSYRWALPEDVGPVLRLLDELRDGRLDAVAFTSASQVENLFTVAEDAGRAAELPGWLNERTVTAAIGPTCARALEQRGVTAVVQPERPKMAPFVGAIGDHFSRA